MVGCSVPYCSNRTDDGYKTFRLPADPQRRKEWVRFAGRHNWVPNAGASFCQVHFEQSAFESHRADGLKKLKPNAIPTIHNVSGPSKRRRRKRKVKQRIEFTFGENDNESFVLAEKVPAESKEKGTVQISEVYGNGSSDTHKKPERRKRLKTIHVTEIVSNGLPLPIGGSREQVDSIKLCSPFSNAENQAVKTNVYGTKRGRPAKMRMKDKGIKCKRKDSLEYLETLSSDTSKEVVDQTFNVNDTTGPIEDNPRVECYVCSKAIKPGHGVSLNIPTGATCVPLVQRLEVIVNMKGVLNVQEMVCTRCASLLNHVDRTEAELDVLKCAISSCTRERNVHSKFRRNPEYTFNVQLLDRFGSLNEGSYNILSLDELFIIQEEIKEMTGVERNDRFEQGESLIGEVEESVLNYDRDPVADANPMELDVDNFSSSVIDEPEERPLCSSSQLNLDLALNDSNSTSILITPDIPASHAISSFFSEESSNITTSSHVTHSSNTHVCKICNFKTPHDSVMIWHLRMHMKGGRWCDFCNVPIPMQESQFLSMKKKVKSGRIRRKPIAQKPKSTLPTILPAPSKESTFSFKPISLPLIPLKDEEVCGPVLVISKDPGSLQESVGIPSAIIELPKNLEMPAVESEIAGQDIIGSRTLPSRVEKPGAEEKVLGKIDGQLNEALCVEDLNPIEDGSERLEMVKSLGNLREEFSATINECDNLTQEAEVQEFSTLPEQHSDINHGCIPGNVGGFANSGIQVSKSGGLNDREVFCEDSVEGNFLDTLSSQQEGKFSEILPEICSDPNEQGMISISNDVSGGNITNKDVSFARSDGLGELAIAYENSVAALMCQSDDSAGILSYQ